MTRDDILAAYRPVRASIQSVLDVATSTCTKSDWRRAARLICFDEALIEVGQHAEMLMDTALFEPNPSGKRAYDRFLRSTARKLQPPDQKVAHALGGAFFSLFRVQSRHEAAGIWMEDLLNEGARIWIIDEGLEKSAPNGGCFGARIFNAGDFHAGLGIVLPFTEEDVADYKAVMEDPAAGVKRGALAPLAYRDAILGTMLDILNNEIPGMSSSELAQLGDLMRGLDLDLPILPALPAPPLRKRA